MIGDSFTANVTSTIRWTDVVEDALNASTAWRISVGGRRTRVINFGLDGIGVPQFGAAAEHIALPFDLDLLLVNAILNDFIRKPYSRATLSGMSEAQVSAYIRAYIMPRVNWFSLYPEALAVVAEGRLGLRPRIEMSTFRIGSISSPQQQKQSRPRPHQSRLSSGCFQNDFPFGSRLQ